MSPYLLHLSHLTWTTWLIYEPLIVPLEQRLLGLNGGHTARDGTMDSLEGQVEGANPIMNSDQTKWWINVKGFGKILHEFNKENKVNKESLSICLTVCLLVWPSGSLASGPSSYEVASPTSQELYVFDANGTHQFTMSLVTGDYKYNFSYRLVCVCVCGNERKFSLKNKQVFSLQNIPCDFLLIINFPPSILLHSQQWRGCNRGDG